MTAKVITARRWQRQEFIAGSRVHIFNHSIKPALKIKEDKDVYIMF
jgi:ribosomal 50S subunit-recycling heat shock protein